jgi:hypothetical protein
MVERSQRQPQTALTPDAANDETLLADSAYREERGNDPFLHANYCLGFFPMDPLDFHAFAKGQLLAMAIFIPAAIALFVFYAW